MPRPTCIFWANLTPCSLKHIFDECIRGLLLADGTKTVVMATHQLHTARAMDTVLLLERGAVVAQGAPAEVARVPHALAREITAQASGAEAEAGAEPELQVQDSDAAGGAAAPPEPAAGGAPKSVIVAEGKAVGEVSLG